MSRLRHPTFIGVAIVLNVLALIGFTADLASLAQRRSDARMNHEHTGAIAVNPPVAASAGSASTASAALPYLS